MTDKRMRHLRQRMRTRIMSAVDRFCDRFTGEQLFWMILALLLLVIAIHVVLIVWLYQDSFCIGHIQPFIS